MFGIVCIKLSSVVAALKGKASVWTPTNCLGFKRVLGLFECWHPRYT